ncbi:MAG: leucine-rich repeat domain-containing protein [Gemmatales bacterium]|nr:leucine-rich repeat domain-containing protein [Gemmatales bacterium]
MKRLAILYLDTHHITDATLAILREAGLLHTLSRALAPKNQRPRNAEEVTELWLSDTRITDAGLKELATLKKLKTLHLCGTGLTDVGLKELAALQNLTTLDLSDTPITDAGLKELAALKNLTTLDLENTRITDAGLKELARLKSLAVLYVDGGTKVTQRGIAELRKALPRCAIIEVIPP